MTRSGKGAGASSAKSATAAWLADLRAEGVKVKRQSYEAEEAVRDTNPNTLPVHLHWVSDAFSSLSRCRTVNETGPQPITIGEVVAYCDLTYLAREEDRKDLLYFVTNLDILYLKRTHERIARDRDNEAKKREREAARRRRR